MIRTWLVLTGATTIAACDFPRDTSGTSQRVQNGIRVGLVTEDASRFAPLMARLSAGTGGRPVVVRGDAEPLLMRLEQGELDLVLGQFDRSSPWSRRVHFSRPIEHAGHAGATREAKAALRNGEHRWAMTADRAVLALERPAGP